jgi:hypothetical protein
MGLTVLEIEVGNPADPEVRERVEFLIDSGAIYSVVPAAMLERLGIKPLTTQEFRLPTEQRSTAARELPCLSAGIGSAAPR